MKKYLGVFIVLLTAAACGRTAAPANQTINNQPMNLVSSAFVHNGNIPEKYTCEGDSINPPLSISGVPDNAKSLALLMDDPDVPKNLKPDGVFDHWTVFNMPPNTTEIKENSAPAGVQGKN